MVNMRIVPLKRQTKNTFPPFQIINQIIFRVGLLVKDQSAYYAECYFFSSFYIRIGLGFMMKSRLFFWVVFSVMSEPLPNLIMKSGNLLFTEVRSYWMEM